MKTLVATIEEAPALTTNTDKTIPIQNLRIAIETTNQFGLDVVKHMKVVAFNTIAKAAAAIGFKPGDHVFLDECRIEPRPYEKDGKVIYSEDLIPNIIVKINKKQYAEIGAQLAAKATATQTEDTDMTI